MRPAIVAVMAVVVLSMFSCSNRTEPESRTGQMITDTEPNDTDQSGIIKTEKALKSLLKSIKAGEAKKHVMLVGKLDLGSNPKLDPAKLIIGEASVYFGHDLDKAKYNGRTVLIKADIRHWKGEEAQVLGHMIVNVQHVAIME